MDMSCWPLSSGRLRELLPITIATGGLSFFARSLQILG